MTTQVVTEAGALDRLRSLATTHRVSFGDVKCSAPLEVVCGRSTKAFEWSSTWTDDSPI